MIQRQPFDYTKWRQELDENLAIEEISHKAMLLRNGLAVLTEDFIREDIEWGLHGDGLTRPKDKS